MHDRSVRQAAAEDQATQRHEFGHRIHPLLQPEVLDGNRPAADPGHHGADAITNALQFESYAERMPEPDMDLDQGIFARCAAQWYGRSLLRHPEAALVHCSDYSRVSRKELGGRDPLESQSA